MEASRLFLTPVFKEIICQHLSFKNAIQLRDALGLPSLKCPITVIDPKSSKKIILPGVNSTTIIINKLIKQHGLDLALILAAANGQNKVVQALLTVKDINVNAINQDGETSLILAAKNGYNEIIQTLLTAKNINVNAADPDGWTALMIAAQYGDNEIVQTLLTAKNININATDQEGKTALMWAAENGHQETVQILRAVGAQ